MKNISYNSVPVKHPVLSYWYPRKKAEEELRQELSIPQLAESMVLSAESKARKEL